MEAEIGWKRESRLHPQEMMVLLHFIFYYNMQADSTGRRLPRRDYIFIVVTYILGLMLMGFVMFGMVLPFIFVHNVTNRQEVEKRIHSYGHSGVSWLAWNHSILHNLSLHSIARIK